MSLVRKLDNKPWPQGFEQKVKKKKNKTKKKKKKTKKKKKNKKNKKKIC